MRGKNTASRRKEILLSQSKEDRDNPTSACLATLNFYLTKTVQETHYNTTERGEICQVLCNFLILIWKRTKDRQAGELRTLHRATGP